MDKLPQNIVNDIVKLANNKRIQKDVIEAMFNGCERGTDIFEYLDCDKYPKNIATLLYGKDFKDEDREVEGGIYAYWESATILIDEVKKAVLKKL